MTNPVHLLSVACLLLTSFLVGAIVGTLVRLVAIRLGRQPAVATTAPAQTAPAAPPLVAAPVIAPLPVAPTPTAPPPAEVPVLDFAATLIALANETPPPSFPEATAPSANPATFPQPANRVVSVPAAPASDTIAPAPTMRPAHVAGETTSGIPVAFPQQEPATSSSVNAMVAEQHRADALPFPSATVETPTSAQPAHIITGGEPVVPVDAADLRDPEPDTVSPLHNAASAVEEITPVAEIVVSRPGTTDLDINADEVFATLGPNLVDTQVPPAAGKSTLDAFVTAEPIAYAAGEPERDAALQPAKADAGELASTPPAEKPVAATLVPEPFRASHLEEFDEEAAMRAIEGNWTPRRAQPRPPIPPVPQPAGANHAVAASARAVIAARRTAEAVIAEVAEVKVEAGRPLGLEAPRGGRRDDLTHIIGVLPVIETALNKLGIYHFDQMGALTDDNIAWIEGHLGIPGRISRELWREQGRELAAVLNPKQAAEN